MMKHANCVVSIMFAKIVRVAPAVVPAPVLAVQKQAAVSSQKESHLVARWVPTQHIQVRGHRVAMRALLLVKSVLTMLDHAMIISAIVPRRLVRRVPQEIAHQEIVRRIKTVGPVRRVIVRHTKIVARALKASVHRANVLRIKIVARGHPAHRTPIQRSSVAGTCPMV